MKEKLYSRVEKPTPSGVVAFCFFSHGFHPFQGEASLGIREIADLQGLVTEILLAETAIENDIG